MPGNWQVRFLGGPGVARRRAYPTQQAPHRRPPPPPPPREQRCGSQRMRGSGTCSSPAARPAASSTRSWSRPLRPEPWFRSRAGTLTRPASASVAHLHSAIAGLFVQNRNRRAIRQTWASQCRRGCGRLAGSPSGPALPRLREIAEVLASGPIRGDLQAQLPVSRVAQRLPEPAPGSLGSRSRRP